MTTTMRQITTVLLCATVAACGAAPEPTPAVATDAPPAVDVQLTSEQIASGGIVVSVVQEEAWAEAFEAPAVLQLDQRRTARIGAVIDARVEDVLVEVGDVVRRGAVLAEMHAHVTHDTVAALHKAASDIARFDGEIAFADTTLARYERLLVDGAASPQDVERARTAVASLERGREMARADEARARAELRHFGVDVAAVERPVAGGHPDDHIPVRTPLAGTVLERLVTPGTTVVAGAPLFVVSDLTALWVAGEVDERWAAHLQTGRQATVRVAAYPEERFTATVTYVGDVVAADTRRIAVRAELANPSRRLKPEMFARLVLAGASRQALTLPGDAVQHVDGRDVVFVERAPGRFAPVAVRTASVGGEDGRVAIVEGLEPGARVVTQGAFLVRSQFQKALFAEDE